MKTPSDDLFILIKSLSSAEKRYFKIFSTIHSGKSFNKKYIILFDAIDRLKQYDEKKLKTRLKDDTLKSNLKMFKSYVSEVILNSLEKYHQNSTKQLQVNHLFAQAHILCSKRLFPLCEKVLKKAESIAESEELFPELINILFLKIEIARATEQYEKIFSTNGHKQRVSSFSNLLHNYTEYLFLGLNAEQVLKKNFLTRKNTDRIMHKQILANTLLLNSTKAKSATAKRMYFNLKSRFLMIMGQDQKAYDVILECISFYKSKNTLANQDLSFYFITLYNKAIIEFIIGQAKTAYETIHCFQEMLERYMHQLSANALVNGNDQLYTLKIGSCISTGDFKAAEKHLDEFEHA
ncbi:MAG: hypothetical protein HYU69_11080 [Bacteroidetes bacterium]|nr:hypothetical protein [Bacteroidota bacterium]